MSVFSEANQPGFTSRAELLSTFDGDTAFVRELVLTFIERVPVLMGEIESGLSAGDRTAVSHAAHSLKGYLSEQFVTAQHFSTTDLGPAN